MTRKAKPTVTTTTPTKAPTKEERTELLERLWAAHTRKLVEKIENTPATEIDAATFNSAAKLLADNGITADALNKDEGGMGKLLAEQARSLAPEASPKDDLRASLSVPLPPPVWHEEAHSALKRMEDKD